VVAAQGNLISPLVEEAFCQSGQRHPAQVPPGWIREAIGSCSLMAWRTRAPSRKARN